MLLFKNKNKKATFATTMSLCIFPNDGSSLAAVQCWTPTKEELVNSVVAVIGYRGTGKSTLIRSFGEIIPLEVKELEENLPIPDGQCLRIGSFQSFLNTQPADRGNIDFLIFCGLPSRRDVERIFERYEHLMKINCKEFYEITQSLISHYRCLVLDISTPVRLGNKKAEFYWCRASLE